MSITGFLKPSPKSVLTLDSVKSIEEQEQADLHLAHEIVRFSIVHHMNVPASNEFVMKWLNYLVENHFDDDLLMAAKVKELFRVPDDLPLP